MPHNRSNEHDSDCVVHQKTLKIVAYYRVSTWKQGRSGLGLEAQQKAVADYAASQGAVMVASFTEVESGRMLAHDRPELAKAIKMAKARRATLCVAKLDRVGRKASDVLRLVDQPGLSVAFADSPNAKGFEIGIRAVIAEEEARAISERTKAALAAAKARGTKLGNNDGGAALLAYKAKHGNLSGVIGARKHATQFADDMRPVFEPLIEAGLSDGAIAKTLNDDGVPTRRDGGRWHETSVRRLRWRLELSTVG
jgi:DNA invertase Pin-like site-specific DNA recombinase